MRRSKRKVWIRRIFIGFLVLCIVWVAWMFYDFRRFDSMGRPSDSYSGSIRFEDRRSLEDYMEIESTSIDSFVDAYVMATGAEITSKDANTYVSGCKTVDGSYITRSQAGTKYASKETMLALGQTYLVPTGYTKVERRDYENGYIIEWFNPKQGGRISFRLYSEYKNVPSEISSSSGCRPTDGSTTNELYDLRKAAQSADTTQSDDQHSQ